MYAVVGLARDTPAQTTVGVAVAGSFIYKFCWLCIVMGAELKLTDREVPVSPVFIAFLSQVLTHRPFEGEIWAHQLSEALSPPDGNLHLRASEAADVVMGNPLGREFLARSYGLLYSLLAGDLAPLYELQSRYHFVVVLGVPRSGGSYLTAELYRAIGMAPENVPNALAHDSFPEVGPFTLRPGLNGWMVSLKTLAEYLTMVEIFFSELKQHSGKVVVPKKLTKGVYAGGLFRNVLGAELEIVLTVRHPAAASASTYEKSGGLPADGRFAVRSTIEGWCRRDLEYTGCDQNQLNDMDYFDVYLRYWEQYQMSLVTSGWLSNPNLRIVAFGKPALESAAQDYHRRYGSELQASEFHVSDKARRLHPQWIERAQPSIDRVAAIWKSAGIPFPTEEVGACW